MERLENPVAVLHEVNARLASLLVRLKPGQVDDGTFIAEGLLRSLLTDLDLAATLVRDIASRAPDRVAQQEVTQYREHLLGIREALPGIQLRLLSEHSRLTAQRTHLQGATAWAEISRKTT